jgi:hypothetical protein
MAAAICHGLRDSGMDKVLVLPLPSKASKV